MMNFIHPPHNFSTLKVQELDMGFEYIHSASTQPPKTSAILFLHGILGDARTWRPYLSAFPEYDTYALTQSGFGPHSDSTTLFDTQRHAKELIAFCQALNLQAQKPQRKFIVVAWSYACHVSLLAAQMAPELFETLMLYELIVPSYGMTNEQQISFTKDITKMMSPIIKAYRRQKEDVAIDAFIAACKNNDFSLAEQSIDIQQIKRENAHTLQKLLTQQTPLAIDKNALLTIHQQVPILIFYGENSREIFKLSSQVAMAAIAQTSGIISQADHLLPEEDPQKLIAILRKALGN